MCGLTTTTRATPLAKRWQLDFLMKKSPWKPLVRSGERWKGKVSNLRRCWFSARKQKLGANHCPQCEAGRGAIP